MKHAVILGVLLLAACGSYKPTTATGNFLSIEHGTARFADAAKGAEEYCAARGLGVKHLGTDSEYRSVSRFECIPR